MQAMSLCKGTTEVSAKLTIFASVELKIFENVIAFLNNRISCIVVTIIQLFSPISPQTVWGAKSSFGGAKARLAPPVEPPLLLADAYMRRCCYFRCRILVLYKGNNYIHIFYHIAVLF